MPVGAQVFYTDGPLNNRIHSFRKRRPLQSLGAVKAFWVPIATPERMFCPNNVSNSIKGHSELHHQGARPMIHNAQSELACCCLLSSSPTSCCFSSETTSRNTALHCRRTLVGCIPSGAIAALAFSLCFCYRRTLCSDALAPMLPQHLQCSVFVLSQQFSTVFVIFRHSAFVLSQHSLARCRTQVLAQHSHFPRVRAGAALVFFPCCCYGSSCTFPATQLCYRSIGMPVEVACKDAKPTHKSR